MSGARDHDEEFHPVLMLPADAEVLDLSGALPSTAGPWTIGRYDEARGIYTQALFAAEDGAARRCVHMGVDLGGPAGVAVHSFADAEVILAGDNTADGDYGPTLVTAQLVQGRALYALYGHLSRASLARSPVGRRVRAGEVLGWLGEQAENGGWPPHVHLQLCWERPLVPDLPGAVTLADRAAARARYPDPRLVLGPIYRDEDDRDEEPGAPG